MASSAEFLRALPPIRTGVMPASSAYMDGALNHGPPPLRIARERVILTQVRRASPGLGGAPVGAASSACRSLNEQACQDRGIKTSCKRMLAHPGPQCGRQATIGRRFGDNSD